MEMIRKCNFIERSKRLSHALNCVLSVTLRFSSTIFKKSWKTARGKSDEKDAQKSKRMEKEEKELRKKFKVGLI